MSHAPGRSDGDSQGHHESHGHSDNHPRSNGRGHGHDVSGYAFDTQCVHAGQWRDEFGSIVPAIYQTSTFSFANTQQGADSFAHSRAGWIYTRLGGPNTLMLGEALARLENGATGYTFATGMAALNFLFWSQLKAGDHVVLSASLYAPTRYVLEHYWNDFGVECSPVDTTDLTAVQAALRPTTKLVHVESPANPVLAITDIAGCAQLAHAAGALLSIDSTVIGPVFQRPLEHGADIVMHSLTKCLNGHSDIIGGALIYADAQLAERHWKPYYMFGGTMDPHQAWLVQRGLKTLAVRCHAAQAGAQAVAEYLAAQPQVERVHYPGLPDHPNRAVHARQASGAGALMSFELKGGLEAGRTLLDNLRLITLAVSLGGVDSLIQHPASMTHVHLTPAERAAAGIGEGLVRLSIGIENSADLIADLEQGLARI